MSLPQQVLCVWLPNWPCQRLLAQQTQASQPNAISQASDIDKQSVAPKPPEPMALATGSPRIQISNAFSKTISNAGGNPELALTAQYGGNQHAFILQVRDPRRGLRVAAADPLAWQLGISPGMSISEATAVVPQIRILDHDPQEDLEALCELAQEAWQFSPMVGIEMLNEVVWSGRLLHEPQGLVMDATGLDQFFGGADQMIELVLEWLRNKGILATAALHSTLGGAWALANYGSRSQIARRLLEWRLKSLNTEPMALATGDMRQGPASGMIGPDGKTKPKASAYGSGNFAKNNVAESVLIDSLSVEALRIEAKTAVALRRLGIRTIGQLRQLPRHGLASRLGTRLIDRLDAVIANKSESLNCFKCQPEFKCEQSLEFATSRRDTIEEVLRRLTLELCQRLQHHGQGALRWVACLRCQKGPAHVMALGLYRPTADHLHLWPLIQGQLERQSSTRLRDIHAVSVQATLTGSLLWKQNELFEMDQMNHQETMARLVDSLSSRLGRRGVLAPQVHSHSQPEMMVTWRPLTGVRSNGNPQVTKRKLSKAKSSNTRNKKSIDHTDNHSAAEPAISDPLRRPLQLYPVPHSIVVSIATFANTSAISNSQEAISQASKIAQVLFKGVRHNIIKACGPERIESGWWSGASHRRDYYRIETDRGQWWWIYHDLAHDKWYLQGSF
jgi:protein ImuB